MNKICAVGKTNIPQFVYLQIHLWIYKIRALLVDLLFSNSLLSGLFWSCFHGAVCLFLTHNVATLSVMAERDVFDMDNIDLHTAGMFMFTHTF